MTDTAFVLVCIWVIWVEYYAARADTGLIWAVRAIDD